MRTRLFMSTRVQRRCPPDAVARRQRSSALISITFLIRAVSCVLLAFSVCSAQNPKPGHSLRTNVPPRSIQNAVYTRVPDGTEQPQEIDLIRYGNQPAAQKMPTAPDPVTTQQYLFT
jgi:hypothetical protein